MMNRKAVFDREQTQGDRRWQAGDQPAMPPRHATYRLGDILWAWLHPPRASAATRQSIVAVSTADVGGYKCARMRAYPVIPETRVRARDAADA
jgi:hypothetical protein